MSEKGAPIEERNNEDHIHAFNGFDIMDEEVGKAILELSPRNLPLLQETLVSLIPIQYKKECKQQH